MTTTWRRTLCWVPVWNETRKGVGLEHLLLGERTADSTILTFDEKDAPYRLTYRLSWNERWQLQEAKLEGNNEEGTHALHLLTDGQGRWSFPDGQSLPALEGCLDIDIWPTPFTNSFPLWRKPLEIGERREFRMAWVFAPDLTVQPQAQAYTRLEDRLYLFESLDGTGFQAELPVDEEGIVTDYLGLFRRVPDIELEKEITLAG